MQRNLSGEIGIGGLERGGVGRLVDGVEPDPLRQIVVEHRSVGAAVEGAEPGSDIADALIAIDRKIKKLQHQRVAWLGPFDVEGPGQRVVHLDHAHGVARFLKGATETIERVGVEGVSRSQSGNRFPRPEHRFDVFSSRVKCYDPLWRRGRSGRRTRRGNRQLAKGRRREHRRTQKHSKPCFQPHRGRSLPLEHQPGKL